MSFKMLLAASVSLCLAGAASAQTPPADGSAPHHGRAMSKADFMAHAHEMFARLDVNHDGKVTAEEAGEARAKMRTAMRDRAFERLDANHDGAISRDEFNAAGDRMKARHGERRAAMHDNGAPTPMGHGPHGPGPMGGHGDFLKRFDANGDGVVTEAEFMGRMEQQFDKRDANHDGQVTRDERGKGHRRGHDGGKTAPPADGGKDKDGERG